MLLSLLPLVLAAICVTAAPASQSSPLAQYVNVTEIDPRYATDFVPGEELSAARAPTPLSAAVVSSYRRYTLFAGTGYCSPSVTRTWTCGVNCNALSGFVPVATGGDGAFTQYWFVGYDPVLRSVVVSHQGTDPGKIIPILTNLDFFFDSLDRGLFPGVPSSVKVHNGFSEAQARAAPAVLAAVRTALSLSGYNHVTIVGHSLGGAIALLDAVYLPLHLPGVQFKTVTYGLPRVGNPAFANWVDANVADFTHINNKDDPVPIIPGRFLGFAHPKGEVHIKDDNAWVACQGQDDPSPGCTVYEVGNIFIADPGDHSGPFDGVYTDCVGI